MRGHGMVRPRGRKPSNTKAEKKVTRTNGNGLLPVRDHIFISYRRDDARGASGRLYDWLRIGFGRERVFRDVRSIGVGKWRVKIDAALERSAVCVAVIGSPWAN